MPPSIQQSKSLEPNSPKRRRLDPLPLTKRKQEAPLPRPFEVPKNFPEAISLALQNKKLTGRTRTKFITIIAHSIYRYKSYPTEDEYLHIVQELVRHWPFLDEGKGMVR